MKKQKTKRESVSDGKKFIKTIHRLFAAQDPVAVSKALGRCLVRARTLTHIRALYSWAVSSHNLSVVDFCEETPSIILRITEQWREMTIYVLSSLPEADSAPELWRTLYGLCQSSTPLGQTIALEWNSCSRSQRNRKRTAVKEYIRYTPPQGAYPEALREVLTLTLPMVLDNKTSLSRVRKTLECSLAIGG
jgi:hypothetical protein